MRHSQIMIKAVCFDLDGTLIDSTEAIVECFYLLFDEIGEPRPPRIAITSTIGNVLENQIATMTSHDRHECARIYRKHYGPICGPRTSLYPGTRELLEALRGADIALGFATSKRRMYAEKVLDYLDILEFFASRIGPDDVSNPKPHPEALLKAASDLGVKPTEMAYVGDTRFDVEAAQAAGMRSLALTHGYAPREELDALRPDALFDSLKELERYLMDQYQK